MDKYIGAYNRLRMFLEEDEILLREPMKNHTYFEIGGDADLLAMPDSVEKLVRIYRFAKEEGLPIFLIGNGSNLLVKDGGIRGLVLKTERVNTIRVEGQRIVAACGALLSDISDVAYTHSLSGFEFACGIPGTLGGAVFMNAGAYDGEMSFVLESVTVLTPAMEVKTLPKEELELGYRTSAVKKNDYIVLEATMALKPGDSEEIRLKIEDLTKRREDRQPLEYPSAGSTFKRPVGYYAGKLIQDAGLKGYQLGGAQVSEKHSGFVINRGNASAEEVLALIAYIQATVKEKFGVDLATEVLIVGEDLVEEPRMALKATL